MAAALDGEDRSALEDALKELDGILHASVDARNGDVWVVRDPDYDQGPIEVAVRNRIASAGRDPAGFSVRITMPSASGPRRRVRFVAVHRVEEYGRVTVSVELEWNDVIHTGSANGERGPAIELKTAATAAVEALEALTAQDLKIRIIGVKPIHAFDSDLMVASLIRVGGPGQRLVGAVVVHDDPLAAVSLAVLSALNRTLGNFLHTSD